MAKELTHINRPMTSEERKQADSIRAAVQKDFPPKLTAEQPSPPPGIPARIQQARQDRGLTRYALGQLAGVSSVAIRDMEQGTDISLSQLQAIAEALGLSVELVDQTT